MDESIVLVLDSDYSTEEGHNLIQKALHDIPVIDRHCDNNDVPFELIEKVIGIICRNYHVMVVYISPTYIIGEKNMYAVSLKTTNNYKYMGNVYGTTLYEVMCKTVIKLYEGVANKRFVKKGKQAVKCMMKC